MKKERLKEEPPDEVARSAPDEAQDEEEAREGRSGEGAHSAMRHWLNEQRNRFKRHDH